MNDEKVPEMKTPSMAAFENSFYYNCALLWINLCLRSELKHHAYWVGDYVEGWDILSYDNNGSEVAYYIPVAFRELYEDRLTEIKEFRGPLPGDVMRTLQNLARSAK